MRIQIEPTEHLVDLDGVALPNVSPKIVSPVSPPGAD